MKQVKLTSIAIVLCLPVLSLAACDSGRKSKVGKNATTATSGGEGGSSSSASGGSGATSGSGTGGSGATAGTTGTGGDTGTAGGTGGSPGAAGEQGQAGEAGAGEVPAECAGTATMCDSFETREDCEAQMGCQAQAGACEPVACDTYRAMQQCNRRSHCTWDADATACMDTGASDCSQSTAELDCTASDDCVWLDGFVCRGEAASCDSLSAEECSMQQGCSEP